ncbi:sensor histidine kinase [Patescibacteria group bacterium]
MLFLTLYFIIFVLFIICVYLFWRIFNLPNLLNCFRFFKTNIFKNCFRFFKSSISKENNNRSSAHPVVVPQEDKLVVNSLWRVNKVILTSLDFEKLSTEVVNVVLQELDYMNMGYRICVLTLIDKKERIVRRVSFSPTPEALEILKSAKVRFHEIKIPLKEKENLLVKVINEQKVYVTHDLSDVFYPEKTREVWRSLQQKVGIKTSLVFPLIIRGESLGAMIFSLSKTEKKISDYEKAILEGFTDAVAVSLENASLYRKLKKTNKRLEEVSALKDEFVSLTSHELRTPLTAVAGSLSTILEGYAGKINTQVKEFVEGALNESNRLIRLVNNLLNISRIEAGRLKFEINTFNLSDTVKEVVEGLKAQAKEKNLKLVFGGKDKLTVKADQDKIREIIINLLGNAIKFTDKGGVAISFWKHTDMAVLSIEDTGRGVEIKDQAKLFKKFERVDGADGAKKKGGTGLGLYICKNLLQGMGGEIWLKSIHGKGSTFYFILPLK